MIVLVNEFGVKINALIVPFGARFGVDRFSRNRGEAVLEFYDTRTTKSFPPFGQFICNMPLEKILQAQQGIQLKNSVTEWKLSWENVRQIAGFIRLGQTT